ncbi:hypothetical protein DFH06DRAFT_918536, partial [Mycena polygramma]
DVAKCNARMLWNTTTKARCHRNNANRIVNPSGQPICISWQRPRKCDRNHTDLHECSGCGQTSHGACDCPLAQ